MAKLAELLLRRKELQGIVDRIKPILNAPDLFLIKVKRVNVTESTDDLTVGVPKLTLSQVNHEYNWHSRQLRLVDAAIQQTNWTTDVEIDAVAMGDYTPPKIDK